MDSSTDLPVEDILDDKKPLQTMSPAKKKKTARESLKSLKRSLIQVQTTTSVPECENIQIQTMPLTTSTNTVIEDARSISPNTFNPQISQIKTEIEDDDGMDMFFQSVKRTIRNTSFTQMEQLDLQMAILHVIREKIFQKNGTQ